MEDFAEFLSSARPDPPVPLIKIAIIDDGIDMSLTHLSNMIQVGESFYSLIGELSGRRGAYFVPSGPHGTLMAKAICSMCPKVMLYIAQLEVLPGPHGQRSFTAESATEVSDRTARTSLSLSLSHKTDTHRFRRSSGPSPRGST